MDMKAKLFILTIALIVAGVDAIAQTNDVTSPDVKEAFHENGKVGLKDSDGTILVPALYDYVITSFSEGVTQAGLKGKWGFVDKTGKEVIPLMYEDATKFSEGVASVKLNGKWGVIDASGQEVIPIVNTFFIGNFTEGLAPAEMSGNPTTLYGKWGYVDKTGREVIPFTYEWAGPFSNGYAYVKLNDKWGFVDKTGKEVIPLIYEDAAKFSEGAASVKLNGKWGAVDNTGKEVVPFIYEDIVIFSEGLVQVKRNGKWGLTDPQGKVVVKPVYDTMFAFSEGMARVGMKKKLGFSGAFKIALTGTTGYTGFKYGYIDHTGKQIIKPSYPTAGDFKNGVAITSNNAVYVDVKAYRLRLAATLINAAMAGGREYVKGMAFLNSISAQARQIELGHYGGHYVTTGGDVDAGIRRREWQQRNVEIEQQYQSDLQEAAEIGANTNTAVPQVKTSYEFAVMPELAMIDKTGKELIPSRSKYVSIERIDSDSVNRYLVQKLRGVDWGEPLFFFGIYDADQKREEISVESKFSRFDMESFAEKGWIVVAVFERLSEEPSRHRYGVIDRSGKVVITPEHDIFNATAFAPHERILAGDMLKRNYDRRMPEAGYTLEEASYGVIDWSGNVIIPKTECAGIILEDDMFVMGFASGEEKYFDLDGNEIAK